MSKYWIEEPLEIAGKHHIRKDGVGRLNLSYICDRLNEHDRLIEENEKLKTALSQVLEDEMIDLMRCGIGGNYGGIYYDIKLNKVMEKVNEAKLVLQELTNKGE